MQIIDAFNDIPAAPLPQKEGVAGSSDLTDISSAQIGFGSKVFRADSSGIWLGAETFATAPFSVDMNGNLVATAAVIGNYARTFRQTGVPTSINIGDIWFDSDDGNKVYRAAVAGATTIAAGAWEASDMTISGSTTFATGYNPTAKVDEVGGTYDSAASGARVRIFPDANTGIQIIDDAAADVFKAIVGGTDVGDVIIGNYAGGTGAKWDKSLATYNILGGIYSTATSGARVLIFPDANTGLQIINAVAADVFKAIIGGTDSGDIIIGDYAGNKGLKWDNSAGTFTVRGTLNADDLTAGTITGRTLQTSSGTGARVVVSGSTNDINIYNSSNVVLAKFSGTEIILSGNATNIYFNAGKNSYIGKYEGDTDLKILSGAQLLIEATTGTILKNATSMFLKCGTDNRDIAFMYGDSFFGWFNSAPALDLSCDIDTNNHSVQYLSFIDFSNHTTAETTNGRVWWNGTAGEMYFRNGGTTYKLDKTAI